MVQSDDTTSCNSEDTLNSHMKPSDAPLDEDPTLYTEEEAKKSEEFKEKGNVYFKG